MYNRVNNTYIVIFNSFNLSEVPYLVSYCSVASFSPCVYSQESLDLPFLRLFPQIQFRLHESAHFPCDERKTIINLNTAELGSLTCFGFETRAVKEHFRDNSADGAHRPRPHRCH